MVSEVRHAIRATRWLPLAVALAVSGALVLVQSVAGRDGAWMVPALAGATAAGVVLGLDDPAQALLCGLPSTRLHRLALRLVPCALIATAGWVGLETAGDAAGLGAAPGLGPTALVALVAVGVAASTVAARWRPEGAVSIGAGAAVAWATLPQYASGGAVGDVAATWSRHAVIVVAVGVIVTVLAARQ